MENDELLGLGGEFYQAELMGLDNDGAAELLGRINRLPKEKQGGALRRLLKRPALKIGGNNSRDEFQEKFDLLPKDIQRGLNAKRLQLVDTRYYIVKDISGKANIDVFQGTDAKNVGLANIANQKLEKDNWFILSAIRLVYGESAEGKEKVEFKELPPVILNGEFELEAGQKKVVGLVTNEVFDNKGRTDVPSGYYKLHNVKVFEPQVEIKMPVKFAAAANRDAYLKVIFIGSSVVPY